MRLSNFTLFSLSILLVFRILNVYLSIDNLAFSSRQLYDYEQHNPRDEYHNNRRKGEAGSCLALA